MSLIHSHTHITLGLPGIFVPNRRPVFLPVFAGFLPYRTVYRVLIFENTVPGENTGKCILYRIVYREYACTGIFTIFFCVKINSAKSKAASCYYCVRTKWTDVQQTCCRNIHSGIWSKQKTVVRKGRELCGWIHYSTCDMAMSWTNNNHVLYCRFVCCM